MTVPETPSSPGYHAHPIRSLLVLADSQFEPIPFPVERYSARRIGDWDTLIGTVPTQSPSTALILEANLDGPGDPERRLDDLIAAAPLLPVVAAVDFRACGTRHVDRLLRIGVSEIVDAELELEPETLAARLRAAHARPLKRRLDISLSRFASGNAMTLVRAAAEVVCDRGLSTDLAGIFRVNERTVGGWCAREGLPPPRRLLGWTRVLLAIALLEEPGRSLFSVARAVGYVDDSGLRRAIIGLFGAPRGKARASERPSFAAAITAFEAELHTCRERLRNTRTGQPQRERRP